jgi:septum site-determining protein MinD
MTDQLTVQGPTNLRNEIKALAIVSGRGGSGKTLVATALAEAMSICDKRLLLVDADFGTGGLSYYLGFNVYGKVLNGLTELLQRKQQPAASVIVASAREEFVQYYPFLRKIKLLPIGRKRLMKQSEELVSPGSLQSLIDSCAADFDYVIFDCRGGVDEDSLSVCAAVNDILVIIETDAAAIRASQDLIETLSEKGLEGKVTGFILNGSSGNRVGDFEGS